MSELQKLRTSSDIIGNGAAMRARLAEDGYLYFPGYLDPERLTELRRDMMHTVAEHGWIAEGTDPLDRIPSQPARRHGMEMERLSAKLAAEGRELPYDRDELIKLTLDVYENYEGERWRDGYIAIQQLESFHRQAHDPRILTLMRTLLGDEDILVHGQRIARVIWPSEGLMSSPHRDFPLIQGTADVVTAWVPLADCPLEMGGLRYLLGSHRSREIWSHTNGKGGKPQLADGNFSWATADWKLGDLVLHHSFTVHSAGINASGRLRVSADYRYQSAKEPVAANSLKPHNCPYVPDWPQLLDGVEWESYGWVDRVRDHVALEVVELAPGHRFKDGLDVNAQSRLIRVD